MAWTKLKRLCVAAAFLVVAFLGILLFVDNATPVPLRVLHYHTAPQPLFWWLYAAFAFGVLVGLAFCLGSHLRGRLGARRLRRVIREREEELARLREDAAHEAEGTQPGGASEVGGA